MAGVPTPLLAVKVSAYVPPVPDAGVPPSVPVPFPLSLNVTPLGSAPVSLSEGVGLPVVVTVKLPAAPSVNAVLFALVITGAIWLIPFTVTVRVGGLGSVTPELSVTVSEAT